VGKRVGQEVEDRNTSIHSGPPKSVEAFVALLVPSASREEVLGDLYERYSSLQQYSLDALRTVPLIILSRIRRTVNPMMLMMQAFALYLSFLGVALIRDSAFLQRPRGFLKIVIPVATALLGLMLGDAYANPRRRSSLELLRGPVLAVGFAFLSQGWLRASNSGLLMPLLTMSYGTAVSLILTSTVRILFPPANDQLQGANGPAFWLLQSGGPAKIPQGVARALLAVTAVIVIAVFGMWTGDLSLLPRPIIITTIVLLLCYWRLKRS
jgi:hypothetical protein